jgi:stress-induced morphogen
MGTRAERIEAILRAAFRPERLLISDDSARHSGHEGAAPSGESHYAILLVSTQFRDMPRLARSRAVHAVLDVEFTSGLHALALTLRTPEEHAAAR